MPSTIIRYKERFDEIIVTANSRTYAALDWAAEEIERIAKGYSRVDTGAMRGGWTWEVVLNGAGRVIYNPIHYTVFHEYGTIYMDAQPMLKPAIEEVMPQFIDRVQKAWYGV